MIGDDGDGGVFTTGKLCADPFWAHVGWHSASIQLVQGVLGGRGGLAL